MSEQHAFAQEPPRKWWQSGIFGCLVAVLVAAPFFLLFPLRYSFGSGFNIPCNDGFDLLLNLLYLLVFAAFPISMGYTRLVRPGVAPAVRLRDWLLGTGVAVIVALLIMPRVGFPSCFVPGA
jgi:hypothetical protein